MLRLSRVGNVKVTSQGFSSISLFGDSAVIAPRSYVFSVQRERSFYEGSEGNLKQFPIFQQPMATVPLQPPETTLVITNQYPYIDVESLNIIGLSTSAILHVGSTGQICAENRTKHIRQLMPRGSA